jgi:iron(III) transport system substrate-binding protein
MINNSLARRTCRALCAAAAMTVAVSAAQAAEVNVYSYRQPQLVAPLFEKFTAETGIKVNTIFAADGLIERIAAEGRNSPADVLLTVDIGRLAQAKEVGITQPVSSDVLSANIPAAYRDADGDWFTLTLRARVIYASRERVKQDSITYEELADPKWRGKLCTRSGQHSYSLGLIASVIANKGEAAAETWLQGVKANLAHKPSGNDRSQVKSVFSGECEIALGNTYYMGLMETNEKEPEQQKWAASVKVLFPNAGDRGTHVNVSGVSMAKYAPHPEEALKLMEFLAGDEAQRIYAEVNHEYPVKPGVKPSERVRSWGELKADDISLSEVAKARAKASELVDKVGFDAGPSS